MAEQYSVVDAQFHVLLCHTYLSFVCVFAYFCAASALVSWRNFRVAQRLHDSIDRSFETVIREHFLCVQLVDNSIVASKLVPASHSLQECFVMPTKLNARA